MSKPKKDPEHYSVICQHCGKGYKAITGSHLRHVHAYVGEHPILDYKRRFKRRWAHSGETLAKMRVHSKRRHEEWEATWPPERILQAIRKRFRQVRNGEPYHFDVELVRAGRKRFGSWDKAVRQAGLEYEEFTGRRHWSPAKVLKEIRQLSEERKEHPKLAPTRLLEAARRSFGTWDAAVEAAGFDPEQFNKREFWTAERVLAAIRKLAEDQGSSAPHKCGSAHRGLWTAACRHFGSYPAAVRAASVDYEKLRGKRTWSPELVVAEIQKLAELRRKEPTGQPMVLRLAALRHFGSWDVAVRAAGLDPVELRRLRWARQANTRS